MDIKVKAFPAVYVNSVCTKHQCKIELNIGLAKKYHTEEVIGAQIISMRCLEGGMPNDQGEDCTEFWELSILAGGEVTISQ